MPNNEPLPPPHKMARVEVQPGQSLPSPELVARLPSQAPPQTSNVPVRARSGRPHNAARQHAGAIRSRWPPAALDRDPGCRSAGPIARRCPAVPRPVGLEAVSTVPVEKSDTSRAPLGPRLPPAAPGISAEDPRSCPPGGARSMATARPCLRSKATRPRTLRTIRSGAPGSDLRKVCLCHRRQPGGRSHRKQKTAVPAPAPARRPGCRGPIPRWVWISPQPRKSPKTPRLFGAGGTASNSGGQTSTLDVGQRIAVRRAAGSGSPARHLPGSRLARCSRRRHAARQRHDRPRQRGVAVGLGPGGPRRVEQGTPEGDDNGVGSLPRARSDTFDLHPTATPAGPVAGTANVAGGSDRVPGRHVAGLRRVQAIGPSAGLGGIGRREDCRPRHRLASRPARSSRRKSPRRSASRRRSRRASAAAAVEATDSWIKSFPAADRGVGGIGRGSSQVVVSGQVHEPLAPFRRGAVHGGLAIGDSAGGQLTEPAIENGLEYFSHTQFSDGHWSLHELPEGVAADPASLGSLHADTAATGLALLTYLGAGYTHQDEKYRDVVRRGVEWLVKHQQPDGDLSYHGSDPAYDPTNDPTHYYSHGIATMALCEAYGMTQDRELREPAQKAIDFIVKSQDPQSRRLALPAAGRQRHLGHRLAAHGLEECPDGRLGRARGDLAQGEPLARSGPGAQPRHLRLQSLEFRYRESSDLAAPPIPP